MNNKKDNSAHSFTEGSDVPEQQPSESAPEIPENERCSSCHKRRASEPHHCPYKSEINDDSETECDCCEECTYQCAMDI